MVNKECYVNIMRHWREEIRQKRTELWKHQSWILQYDNTPAHTSMLVLWVFGQKQKYTHGSTIAFIGLSHRWLFPLPKTEDTNEIKAICYDWEDKKNRNRNWWIHQKARSRSVARIGKNLAIRYYFQVDKIVIDK